MGQTATGAARQPIAGSESSVAPTPTKKSLLIIIVGPPGAGKGTQANRLSAWLDVPHLASGDFFRAERNAGTPMGLLAQSYLDKGLLVPDDITSKMVLERLRRPDTARGVVLDGYPRTLSQAEALDAALANWGPSHGIDVVLRLTVSEDTVLHRMADRLSCPNCGRVYNARYNPPRVAGICDNCGHELSVRSDDKLATFRRRLEIYRDETWPMIEYYERRGLVEVVDGEQDMESVFRDLQERIRARGQ